MQRLSPEPRLCSMSTVLTLTVSQTFELYYEAAHKLLRGTWTAPVLDADLRSHYAELLALAQRHGCYHWLLDMRARNWHMPSFGRWFSTEFAAEAHAALGQPLYIGYLLSARHQALEESDREQAAQHTCLQHQLYLAAFTADTAEAEALAWLQQQQAVGAAG
jgi:hypothetical protein